MELPVKHSRLGHEGENRKKFTILKMEAYQHYLKGSTIHGLVNLTKNQSYIKIFWTFIVVMGFTCAGVMISNSVKEMC